MKRHHIRTKSPQFSVDKLKLTYEFGEPCSNIKDSVVVTSSDGYSYLDYSISNSPDWITIDKGNPNGITSTMSLVISNNITEDKRTGTILLVQNSTNSKISISITQASQFGEDGLPTSYPTVGTETILGSLYNTAYLGEQSWVRENLNWYMSERSFDIVQGIIDIWKTGNGSWWVGDLLEADYNSTFNKGYNKLGKEEFITKLLSEYGDTDININKHQVPSYDDFKYMLGFIACKSGGVPNTTGQSIMKYNLDSSSSDGFDCIRGTYPSKWNSQVKSTRYNGTVIQAMDTYLLGFQLGGGYQPYALTNGDTDGIKNFKMMNTGYYHVRDSANSGSTDESNWDGMVYYDAGWQFPNPLSKGMNNAFITKSIKTVRYLPLTWSIYDNGSDIIKVNKGDSIPSGYTEVPIGALRGAWFANQTASRSTLAGYASQIENYISNGWDTMG